VSTFKLVTLPNDTTPEVAVAIEEQTHVEYIIELIQAKGCHVAPF
jgi:hypothetical protein